MDTLEVKKKGTTYQLWSPQFPKSLQKLSKMSPKTLLIPKCLLNVSKISPKSIQNQNVSKNSPTFFQKLFKECPKPKMYLKCLQTHLKKVCKKCHNRGIFTTRPDATNHIGPCNKSDISQIVTRLFTCSTLSKRPNATYHIASLFSGGP